MKRLRYNPPMGLRIDSNPLAAGSIKVFDQSDFTVFFSDPAKRPENYYVSWHTDNRGVQVAVQQRYIWKRINWEYSDLTWLLRNNFVKSLDTGLREHDVDLRGPIPQVANVLLWSCTPYYRQTLEVTNAPRPIRSKPNEASMRETVESRLGLIMPDTQGVRFGFPGRSIDFKYRQHPAAELSFLYAGLNCEVLHLISGTEAITEERIVSFMGSIPQAADTFMCAVLYHQVPVDSTEDQ